MEYTETLLADLVATDTWIRELARRLVHNDAEAEDVAQDTWVQTLSHRPDRKGPIRRWMRTVARNLALNRRRSEARRADRECAAARPERLPPVVEQRAHERTRYKVASAVFALEEPYRSTLYYRYFEDLPNREIADRFNITLAAVETRLRRGIRMLRARLDRDFGDRRTWCAALMPFTAAAAMEATAVTLTGALIMGMKVKIGLAAVAALTVALVFWPRSDGVQIPGDQIDKHVPPVVEKANEGKPENGESSKETAGTTGKKPGPEPALISLTPARGSIVGRVTDQDNMPIPEARIRAFRFVPGALELEELISTETDRAGRYELKPIEVRCVVEASAIGHYSERGLASPFTRKDFNLGKPGVLRGRVIRVKDATPVADTPVAVYPWRPADATPLRAWPEFAYAWRRPPLATRRTNEQGEFRFEALRPGLYQLRVLPRQDPPMHTRHEGIEVLAGRDTIRDLVLPRGKTVVGRVTDKDTGTPIPGAEVFMDPNRFRCAVADRNGRYRIAGLDRSVWGKHIMATASGYWPRSMSLGWNVNQKEPVIDFPLEKGARVRGRVTGPEGPVAGARVSAAFRLYERLEDTGWTIPFTITDDQGAFEITAPIGESRRLYVVKDGLGWGTSEDFVLTAGEQKSGIVVRLTRGGRIQGRVTDGDGKPVNKAGVALREGLPLRGRIFHCVRNRVFTRPDGRYDIEGVPAGTYTLSVLPPGVFATGGSSLMGMISSPVLVSEGVMTTADVVLPRGTVISGRVMDTEGRPVLDALVKASLRKPGRGGSRFRLSPPCDRTVLTDAGGSFRLEGLGTQGRVYNLTVQKYGFAAAFEPDVFPGGPEVRVTLIRYRKLEGRVIYASTGKPAQDFWIGPSRILKAGEVARKGWFNRYFDFPPYAYRGHFEDREGRFMVWLEPGAYWLQARTEDGQRSDRRKVHVPAAGDLPEVELRVWPAASLRGQVHTDQNELIRSAQLIVYDLGSKPVKSVNGVTPDSEGHFIIAALPPGTFLVYARATDLDGKRRAITRKVTLQVGSDARLDLPVALPADVQMVVTGENRKPLDKARVEVGRTDGAPMVLDLSRKRLIRDLMLKWQEHKTRFKTLEEAQKARKAALRRLNVTGQDGRLAPWSLLPGDYVIEATAPGYKTWKKTMRIASGAGQTIQIRLKKE